MYFGLNGAIFNTSKKYRYDLIFTLSLIIIVYVLNLYLIPIYGIEGAAISTAIALVIYNMGRLLFVYFTYKIHPFNGRQLIVIVIGLLCFYTRSITPDLSAEPLLNALVVTSLTVLCYFGSILVLNLEPELKNYLRNGIRHISKNFKS
jgi:O-antigen/teichoic acid export membrane protein